MEQADDTPPGRVDSGFSPSILQARAAFPRGLEQPEGAFRFSADALLLAKFGLASLKELGTETQKCFVDLGTGCGVVGLALLLEGPTELCGWGIEREGVLAAAAVRNAARLGFSGRFHVRQMDVEAVLTERGHIAPVPLVLANPPWRIAGTGREPASPLRRGALFGRVETLLVFARGASALLAPGGRYVSIVGVERLDDQKRALMKAGLRLLRVHLLGAAEGLSVRFAVTEGAKPSPSQNRG